MNKTEGNREHKIGTVTRKDKKKMASIDEVFGGNSLKAADLRGRHVPVTIESTEVRSFDDGNKVVIHFAGKDKVLICNVTNANAIAEITGSRDTDAWIGHTITLFPTKVEFSGRWVDAIRVELPTAAPQQQAQPVAAPVQPAPAPLPADQDGGDDIPF